MTILAPEEVLPFFEVLRLEDRPLMATAILTGLRKGELCGLKKTDVDLGRRLLTVRCSYERPFPKSSQQRVVRIPEELVPFLEYALATSPSEWLLPSEDGRMRAPTWKPEKVLQPALKRAAIVDGYTHVCRRKGCTHQEEHRDAELRRCPVHGMRLWPKARVRHIRFHDLRHTYGSGARDVRREPRLGAAPSRPQRSEDHRAALNALLAGLHGRGGEPAPLRPGAARSLAPGAECRGLEWRKFASAGGASPAAWYVLGTVGRRHQKRRPGPRR